MTRQCGHCFAVVDLGGACLRCGADAPCNAPLIVPEDFTDLSPLDIPASPQWEPRAVSVMAPEHLAVGLLRRAVLFLVLAAVSMVALDFLYGTNTAAQASWAAQSQIGGQRDARRAELRQGVADLEALHRDLVTSYGDQGAGASERVAWSLRWRERLADVPVSYRLQAPIAMAPANARAEEALRKARIYLSSMEGAMAKGQDPAQLRSLERSFLDALVEARGLVY